MAPITNSFSAWLLRVCDEFSDASTLEQSMHLLLDHLKATVPHQSAAVLMLDENTDQLRIYNARNISYSFSKKHQREMHGDLLPRVLLRHEVIAKNNMADNDPERAHVRLEHDFKSICLVPILHQQRAVGYLHCDRDKESFGAEEVRRLRVVARLAGLLLEKVTLLELTRHLERTDSVSKALKYHAFLAEYYRERARARASDQPLSLLFLNVDGYMRFVATCGVCTGHELLHEICRIITDTIRAMDLVGRFSANQFIVCLSNMGQAEAEKMLADICRAVKKRVGDFAGQKVSLTGVAMTFARPDDFKAPLAKVLIALGGGMITALSRGGDQIMSVAPPTQ